MFSTATTAVFYLFSSWFVELFSCWFRGNYYCDESFFLLLILFILDPNLLDKLWV